MERLRFERELFELNLPEATSAGLYFGEAGEAGGAPVRLEHFHIRKFLDPGIRALMPDPSPSVMTPAQMNPGYVLPSDPRRTVLQSALSTLLSTKYASALLPNMRLRVALVDLSEAKQHTPIFAGHAAWGPGSAVDGASLPKILALYAVYQLRFDLNTYADRNKITKGSVLRSSMTKEWAKKGLRSVPDLTGLFKFVERVGHPVNAALRKIHDIHHNSVSRALIIALGFEYIGSVALQSGLFDEVQSGLWLNAAYNKPPITWTSSPFPKLFRHNATALATASYFTLLAQGRLVNQTTSKEIAGVLAKRICMDNGLIHGIQRIAGIETPVTNKCGYLPPLVHEGIHVVRQIPGGKKLEYVIAVLKIRPTPASFITLGRDLDDLIVAANP